MKFQDILDMADSEAFVHPESSKVPAVVHTAVYKKSGSGNDMIAASFRVTGGPNAGKGRPIRAYLLFNDSGRQQVSNLGYPAKEFSSLAGLEAEEALAKIAAVIVGKPCAIDIVPDEFDGRPQNKIKWIHPPQPQTSGPKAPAKAPKTPAKATETPDAAEDGEDELEALQAQLAAAKAAKAARLAARTEHSEPPSDLPF